MFTDVNGNRATLTNAFTIALFRQASRLNFEQFCEIIEEPMERSGRDNSYAFEKWSQWQMFVGSAYALGTFLPKLVDGNE